MAVPRLAADDGAAAGGWAFDQPQAGPPPDAWGGDRRAWAEAAGHDAGGRPQGLSPPAARACRAPAEPGLVRRYQCAAASGVRDGGWPPAIGLQEQVANRRKRRGSKARVVSVTEKASKRRQVGDRK